MISPVFEYCYAETVVLTDEIMQTLHRSTDSTKASILADTDGVKWDLCSYYGTSLFSVIKNHSV
ncbi:hypothetical protein T4D_9292 [Trichinella pseudospiralis]|uniref:Uncharacterized protein n=1 Tax=Trichinella pseudospiralis TaxID=6337 RepID=A0A0V1F867_TRIPS|nr:hypothetical protein T4D_9292 [Trichinella pseudospiralis]